MVILREKQGLKKERGAVCGTGNILKKIERLGYAVDIGTTTVAMAGFVFMKEEIYEDDKKTGSADRKENVLCLGRKSALNAQTKLGKDVMMRIMHAVSGKKATLQKLIVEQVEAMAKELTEESFALEENRFREIPTEFVIVGNTTMCHLFLGEDTDGLKGMPFVPAYHGNRMVSGEEIGCRFFGKAEFFVLSGIASHVGSDALSVLCETGMRQKERVILAVDLGTNAEILLNKRGNLWCCSAAAGPAFEGRGISAGRVAGEGVVTGAKFALHTGNLLLEYIPGKEVCGICGSGLIDLLAEFRRGGLITEDGYLLSKEEVQAQPKLQKWSGHMVSGENGERAFLIYEGKKRLLLTQTDIRNLQLAKGAIGAAVSVLLRENGLTVRELDGVILSGVLGNSIRLEHAMKIGLVPRLEKGMIRPVGNAALEGAVTLLQRKELRTEWERIAEEVTHLELAGREDFSELFMKAMGMDFSF